MTVARSVSDVLAEHTVFGVAGGVFVPDESHVVVDDDLVTGRSAADLGPYFDKLVETTLQRSG